MGYKANEKRRIEAVAIYTDIKSQKIKLSDVRANNNYLDMNSYLKMNGYLKGGSVFYHFEEDGDSWTMYIGPLHPVPGNPLKFDSNGNFTKLTMKELNQIRD